MLRQGQSTFDERGGWKGTPYYLAPEVIKVNFVIRNKFLQKGQDSQRA
jgi:hypothetical protein